MTLLLVQSAITTIHLSPGDVDLQKSIGACGAQGGWSLWAHTRRHQPQRPQHDENAQLPTVSLTS